MNSDAQAIYQSVLEKLSQAIMTCDEATWLRYMQVPHFMTTCDGKLVHETQDDARRGLQDFNAALKRLDVSRLDRRCDTARMTKGDTIVGFHTTKMFASDGTAYPPFPVRWVMHRHGDKWLVAKSDSALSAQDWEDIPHNTLSQFEAVGGNATKSRRILMQQVLDRIDSVYLSADFEGWRDCVLLPLVYETRSGAGVFETEAQLRKDFELYQHEFRIHRITELTRVVKSAEIIDDDMMLGTYRVHVLSGTNYVVPPWDGAMTFKKVDGRWRVTKLMGALGHLNWKSNAGRLDDDASGLPPIEN